MDLLTLLKLPLNTESGLKLFALKERPEPYHLVHISPLVSVKLFLYSAVKELALRQHCLKFFMQLKKKKKCKPIKAVICTMEMSKILVLKRNRLVWYVILSKNQQMSLAQVRKYTLKKSPKLVSSMVFNINRMTQHIWHILYFMVRLE